MLPFSSLLRAAALGTSFALLSAGVARADNAFGGYMSNQPTEAARARPPMTAQPAPGADAYASGATNDFGAAKAAQQPSSWQFSPTVGASRVTSTKPMAGPPDLVGIPGSPQDDLAREIYVPGSRPPGF